MKGRWWFIFLGITILLGALVRQTVVHLVETDATKARILDAPIPVETVPARVMSLVEVIGASGTVEQSTTLTLTSRIEGRITRMPAELGATVAAGELLVWLDDRIIQAAIESLEAHVESCQTRVNNDARQLKRLETLQDQKMTADVDVEKAETTLAISRQNLAAAHLELMKARIDLEHTKVQSPIDGYVLDRLVNVGETMKPGQELFKLGQLDKVYMVARVSEDKVGTVTLGLDSEVSYTAFPGEVFTGVVVKIDPKIDPHTRSFAAYIEHDNADLRLKPGLTGFARIRREKAVLAVPSAAIINPLGDHATLFTVDGKARARLRSVRVGMLAEGMREVVTGLQEGEDVVTAGQLTLQENEKVHHEKTRSDS